ncbi:nucleotidyltransferase family protein [Vreelandella sp. EE22]
MNSEPVIALVMAAGYSRRFGAADKRLARLGDGDLLLASSIANARGAFSMLKVVVRTEDALDDLDEHELIRVTNAHKGLGASIGEAFAALIQDPSLADTHAAAVLLGDMPYLQPATLIALKQHATPETIVSPSVDGTPGHPVIFGRAFWPALARLESGEGARAVLKANADHHRAYPVDDPGVLRDIDRPSDIS